MSADESLMSVIHDHLETEAYKDQTWEGTFAEYLAIARENPAVIRNAYQRIYDMVLSYGYREITRQKRRVLHYNFFEDPLEGGRDAVFGLDEALMRLVGIFKSAAYSYGTEKRVLLLHGPVGSAKS
ncbi:MAG: PrkA family serine protein kinase, partial [Planctomycetota bacterium]